MDSGTSATSFTFWEKRSVTYHQPRTGCRATAPAPSLTWVEHRYGLAEHCCLGFNTANAPAKNTEAVNHRGVRVRADKRVGEGASLAVNFTRVRDTGKVLNVHLVNDSRSRRHNLEVIECRLAPTKELVALTIALVLKLDVAFKSVLGTEKVRNDRVVDYQFCRS